MVNTYGYILALNNEFAMLQVLQCKDTRIQRLLLLKEYYCNRNTPLYSCIYVWYTNVFEDIDDMKVTLLTEFITENSELIYFDVGMKIHITYIHTYTEMQFLKEHSTSIWIQSKDSVSNSLWKYISNIKYWVLVKYMINNKQ